jgi:hypothetical protein
MSIGSAYPSFPTEDCPGDCRGPAFSPETITVAASFLITCIQS